MAFGFLGCFCLLRQPLLTPLYFPIRLFLRGYPLITALLLFGVFCCSRLFCRRRAGLCRLYRKSAASGGTSLLVLSAFNLSVPVAPHRLFLALRQVCCRKSSQRKQTENDLCPH